MDFVIRSRSSRSVVGVIRGSRAASAPDAAAAACWPTEPLHRVRPKGDWCLLLVLIRQGEGGDMSLQSGLGRW